MGFDKLKELNKPDNLLQEYNVRFNLYAIPPDTLEQILTLLSGIGQSQPEIQQTVNALPTWENVCDTLEPTLARMNDRHSRAVESSAERLKQEHRQQMERLTTDTCRTITERTAALERTLKARDMSPWKLRLKWLSVGAILPVLCWALLWLLKIW